ncbi:M16 family metallopeptidase [Marimonas lutisalis]|uniref:M16 family metallopeptidase n=1 Tax=Marimonas lutisalis TaxID=2545756 RepID=UPI0010F7ED92|nr:pitrilysin family protein [Marimonas lutisalis]
MLRILTMLSALVALATVARADDQVTHFTLDNGMEVVVIEDHRAPVVVHMVWYRAGSADEKPGVSGVAHFLEHLLFKGTDTLAPGEFSRTVARNGGNDNAFTSFDYTAYYQRVAADRLELMMKMESDRMVNLRLDEGDIATERAVIIEERNMRTENSPSALFREQKRAAQYLNHRYGVPVIGWRHEMEGLDLKAALDYYKQYYAPNNAILVVAGDVQPDDVRALAEKYYGALPANPDLGARTRPSEPRQMAERRMVFRDARVAQPYVSRSYIAPERDSGAQEKAAALTMLAELLGGGTTSYLAEKLQFETQTAVYTAAFYDGLSLDDSTFSLIAVPADGVSLQQAEDAMDAAVKQFIADGIDPQDLDRIKMQLRAAQIYARDDVERLANRYGQALTQGLTVADVQAWPDILQAVTADDILSAAQEVLDRDKAVTGWLMSKEQEMTQ